MHENKLKSHYWHKKVLTNIEHLIIHLYSIWEIKQGCPISLYLVLLVAETSGIPRNNKDMAVCDKNDIEEITQYAEWKYFYSIQTKIGVCNNESLNQFKNFQVYI